METLLPILSRWAHILAAITALGGAMYMRFILIPAATAVLDDEQHRNLRGRVTAAWKKVLMACIGLLLVSGIYNLIVRMKGDVPSLYHVLFGIKFLAAMGVFFLGSCLTGRAAAFEGMRQNAPKWLAVTVGLGILVVLISGVLKNLG